MDKVLEIKEAAIEQAVQEFTAVVDKAFEKIERTGYPENPFNIAELILERWRKKDRIYI